MHPTRWTQVVSILALIAAAVAVSCTAMTPKAPAALDPAAKIERGRYLVAIMGCGDCHTPGTFYGVPDTSRLLSGSEIGWVGPWGIVYAANLTPDQTGLGSWSEDDIVKALRSGVRPDGTPLSAAMPWPNAARLTDEDVNAVAAYLKALPAVSHQRPPALPPGTAPSGPAIVFPPPPAWDGAHLPPPGAPAAQH